jgi:DNA-binding GntR family transcriptional regulator
MTLALEELAERHLRSRDALPDAIAKALREAVFAGVFAPNERLHQDDIAKRFGVSRVPVREALIKLVAEGLAVQHMNKGVRVAPLTREDFQDIMEMRILLEPHALALSAPRLTYHDYEAAQQILAQVRHAGVGPQAATLHWQFHMRLYACADRPRLLGHIEALHVAINRYVLPIWRAVGLSSDWDDSHQAIVDALRAKDVAAATMLTRQQIADALNRMAPQLSPAVDADIDNDQNG